MHRLLALPVVLVIALGVTGCSSDGDSDDASTTEVESVEYCEAVRTGSVLYEEYKDVEQPPDDAIDEFLDALDAAIESAPAELRSAYSQVLRSNDPELAAQDQIDEYNRTECGVEPIGDLASDE